jgi:hypothetical protein
VKNIIYPKAGKIVLVKYNTDGSLAVSGTSLVGNTGVIEKIESKIEIKTQELADGNSDYPMGVYDVGSDGSVTVSLSEFNPALYAALSGASFDDALASSQMWSADEEHSVGEAVANKVTLKNTPATLGSMVVIGDDSSPLVKVSSNPVSGQYSVSGTEMTFSASDNGKPVFVTYDWTASTASKIALPESISRPVYQAIISTEATDRDQVKKYAANIVIDKCKSTGGISQPPQQRTPQGWNFTLKVMKPRSGYNPVYWKYAAIN